MKQTVSFYDFEQAFHHFGRLEQFGYDGLRVLFDWIESYEEDSGEELELDVIALCCDYAHDTVEEIAQAREINIEGLDVDEARDAVRDYLEQNTILCGETEEGFVYCTSF